MAFPTYAEMFDPLLLLLSEYPHGVRPMKIYAPFASRFPQIDPDELHQLLPDGRNEWQNRVQWTRELLAKEGLLDRARRGIWTLTPAGFAAAQELTEAEHPNPPLTEEPDSGIVSEPRSRPSGDSYSKEAAQKMLIALLHQLSNTDLPWSAETSSDGSVALSYNGRLRVIVRP